MSAHARTESGGDNKPLLRCIAAEEVVGGFARSVTIGANPCGVQMKRLVATPANESLIVLEPLDFIFAFIPALRALNLDGIVVEHRCVKHETHSSRNSGEVQAPA